jgi:hypothetical protein
MNNLHKLSTLLVPLQTLTGVVGTPSSLKTATIVKICHVYLNWER